MNETIEKQLLTLRIIVGAMGGGLLAFGAVAVAVVSGGFREADPSLADTLLMVLGVMALGVIPASVVVRTALRKQAGQAAPATSMPDGSPALGRYATATIIGCALFEGWGFFGAVTHLLTGNQLALIAVGVAILGIAAHWPTRAGVEKFGS